jgi:hypothetical protein
MKSLYVDLDYNKLLAGPLNPLIATQQVFYLGNTETISVDFVQRDTNSNILNYVPATGTTISMVVGIPGSVVSIPAMTRSTQAGITGTATASLYSAITATGTASKYSGVTATVTASLYGNITALASATITRGTACTLSLSVASVIYPLLQVRAVSDGQNVAASTTTVATGSPKFGNATTIGTSYIEIISDGQNLWGSPLVYQTCVTGGPGTGIGYLYATANVSQHFAFSNGKLVSVSPSALDPVEGYGVKSFSFVADPDYVYSANSVTVASGGTGFPDGVNIPFTIPSDEAGDGRPCTGVMQAIGGVIVTASIVSHGSRFTSSITNGKSYAITPAYKVGSISVTCAGAGYYDTTPSITIDSTYYDSTIGGAFQAAATVITTASGGVSVVLNSSGYGYTATPGITIAQPRLADGVRFATLTNTPTGYADGIYSCAVAASPSGTNAEINMEVTSGVATFSIINSGAGYVSAPVITCAAPNLLNSIQKITITCAGFGYTTSPIVTIYGAGSGASATAVLADNGSISSVEVVSVGTGYTGTVTVGFSQPDNLGKIESISIVTAGTNYLVAPTITFTGGGGSGAVATASIVNGGLSTIELSSEGSGYSTAPAIALDASPTRTIFSGVLTVTTTFVNSILPATAVTLQINSATTIGASTVLQLQAAVAGTL